jgi:hypothetical protein
LSGETASRIDRSAILQPLDKPVEGLEVNIRDLDNPTFSIPCRADSAHEIGCPRVEQTAGDIKYS